MGHGWPLYSRPDEADGVMLSRHVNWQEEWGDPSALSAFPDADSVVRCADGATSSNTPTCCVGQHHQDEDVGR